MLSRNVFIERDKILADAGESVSDVRVKDSIGRLFFVFKATNSSTGNKANPLPLNILSVQIVDGSKVIWSLSGAELLAYAMNAPQFTYRPVVTELANAVQTFTIPVQFGRWAIDPDLALLPSRFSNLQIRVRWDLSTVRAVGAGSFISGSGRMSIIAEVTEGLSQPSAMIAAKQHYSFTTAASGTLYIDLPTDYDLVGLMIGAKLSTAYGLSGISAVRLQADQGRYVFIDSTKDELLQALALTSHAKTYAHHVYAKNGDTLVTLFKFQDNVVFAPYSGDTVIGYNTTGIGQAALAVTTGGTAAASELNIQAHVNGHCPLGYIWYPFGDWEEPSTWLSVLPFGQLRLELTQDTSSAVGSVVIFQYYRY
jgi:hypothetical protein